MSDEMDLGSRLQNISFKEYGIGVGTKVTKKDNKNMRGMVVCVVFTLTPTGFPAESVQCNTAYYVLWQGYSTLMCYTESDIEVTS